MGILKDFLYLLFRLFGKFIARLYIKRMEIHGLENIPNGRPILYASSHFNSFFDSSITHLIVQPKVHALARGDVFKNKTVASFLRFFYILPIWRLSDGKRNMLRNAETFNKCHEVFQRGEHVLIYPEGRCDHQPEVLPLKNGTATMIYRAWKDNLDVAVIPLVISYDAYKKLGKRMNVCFGTPIEASGFSLQSESEFTKAFTPHLFTAMQKLVLNDFKHYSFFKNPWYIIGWAIYFPVYLALRPWVRKKFEHTVFYDSVFYGCLFLGLTLYSFLLTLMLCLIF